MVDIVGFVVVLFLVLLFGFLTRRAWGSKNAILKWVGVVLAGLLTLLFTLVLIGAVIGTAKLNQNYNADHPVADIKVAGTPEQLARGEKIAQVCGCHLNQGKLPLTGNDFLGGPGGAPPIGSLWARNLTPGGELKDWSDGEIIRAIREGVHKNGRSLVIMPAEIFHNMSDADVQALVAYLRSQPAVTPDVPPNHFNLLGAVFASGIAGNLFTVQPHLSQPVIAPPEGPTAEYGQYLVNIIGCRQCHAQNLAGGKLGGGPAPGPNLTALVPTWSLEQFANTIHTGVDPTGHTLNPEEMPWKEISAFANDDDLKALYAYLHGLPTLPDNPKQ